MQLLFKLTQRPNLSVLAASLLAIALAFTALTPPAQADSLPKLAQLIKQNRNAVVHISVEAEQKKGGQGSLNLPEGIPEELREFFRGMPRGGSPGLRPPNAMGSGFIISKDGYIVTNTHVIDGADTVTVTLNDKRELSAEVIGQDDYSDVALLKVEADNLPAVTLGNSDQLEVGQWVFAIGAPFGLEHSATQGIVSALSRSLPDGTYVPFIQTDVAVNPGNSGGPLFDLNGNVVGVNSQIYSRSGGYMGISFAIPVNLVKNVTEQLKSDGQVSRGWLGVEIQNLDQDLANSFGMDSPRGALVASVVPNSPASKSELQAGDVIVKFAGADVSSANHLPLLVGNTPAGDTVAVGVLRNGKEQSFDVTIDQLADKGSQQKLAQEEDSSETGELGLAVTSLSEADYDVEGVKQGVMVREVRPDSPADRAGIRSGDIILSANNSQVTSPTEFKRIVEEAPQDRPLPVLLMRDQQKRFVAVRR